MSELLRKLVNYSHCQGVSDRCSLALRDLCIHLSEAWVSYRLIMYALLKNNWTSPKRDPSFLKAVCLRSPEDWGPCLPDGIKLFCLPQGPNLKNVDEGQVTGYILGVPSGPSNLRWFRGWTCDIRELLELCAGETLKTMSTTSA